MLARAGGVLDQPAVYMRAMEIIGAETTAIRQQEIEEQRARAGKAGR